MSYPQAVKDQFLTLRTEGRSYAQIAKVLKVSRHTLILWGKSFKVQIDADRAVDQEELVSTLQLRRVQRLKLLAELYHRVSRAIEKSDLTARGVGTLVTILLKLNTAIEVYDIDPAACDLTPPKTEPTDQLTENTPPQAPESPELTDVVQKTEPKLNQGKTLPRLERSTHNRNLMTLIRLADADFESLQANPPSPENEERIKDNRRLVAYYQRQLIPAATGTT